MNIQVINKGMLSYVQIDDMYTEQEINIIRKELVFLETIKQSPDQTKAAQKNGVSLKKGHGIFLDEVYANREFSKILTINRKLFDRNILEGIAKHGCFYEHLIHSNRDSTLVNFYGSTDTYRSHRDSSIFTAVTFFSLGVFSGGNLSFSDYDVSIDPVEGRTVLFPGCVRHEAEPVIAEPGNYRVTMAQFINYNQE